MIEHGNSRKLVQYNLDDEQLWEAKKNLKTDQDREVEMLLQVLPKGSPQTPSGSNPPSYIPSGPKRI